MSSHGHGGTVCLRSWRCSQALGPAPSCTMPESKAQTSVRRHPKQPACRNCFSTRLSLHPARVAPGCLAYPGMHASSKLLSEEEGMFRKPRAILFPHFHTPKDFVGNSQQDKIPGGWRIPGRRSFQMAHVIQARACWTEEAPRHPKRQCQESGWV